MTKNLSSNTFKKDCFQLYKYNWGICHYHFSVLIYTYYNKLIYTVNAKISPYLITDFLNYFSNHLYAFLL